MNQFLKLRQALCRALGRLPNEAVEARCMAGKGRMEEPGDWAMFHGGELP
jgi:hypothetical protein